MTSFLKFVILACVFLTSTTSWAVNDLLVSDPLNQNTGGSVWRYSFDNSGAITGVTNFLNLQMATGMRINPANGELLVTGQVQTGVDINNNPVFDGVVNRYNAQTGAPLGTFASGLGSPADIKVGPDNNVYVANTATNTISVFQQNGTPVTTLGGPITPFTPTFLAWDSSNRLYVSSLYGNSVLRYNTMTSTFDTFASGNGLNGATGLAFKDGKLYVSSVYPAGDAPGNPSANPTKILTFNADGSVAGDFASLTTYPNPGPGYPPNFQANPSDLLFLDDGSLLVGLLGQGQVARLSSTGTYLGPYAIGGGLQTANQLLQIAAVPEPTTWIGLSAAGMLGAWCWKRRRSV